MRLVSEKPDVERRAAELLRAHRCRIFRRTDGLFGCLLLIQFVAVIASAFWAPDPARSSAAVGLGHAPWFLVLVAAIATGPAMILAWCRPGRTSTRYCVSVSQMAVSSLLMHVSGTHGATHFHVFASLAFLGAYRDPKILIAPTLFAVVDRCTSGLFWPLFSFDQSRDLLTIFEYCTWMLIVDAFLVAAIRQNDREMVNYAQRTAELEESRASSDQQTEELNRIFAKERAIIEGALDGVIAIDRDGRITTWNCKAEQMFGWTASEALGRQFTEVVLNGQSAELVSSGLMNAGNDGDAPWRQRCELVGVHRSGREFPIEIATTPIRHGDESTYCAFVRDISERRQAELALRASEGQARRLALVAAHTHNAVIITGIDGRIEWINEGFTRITEYTLEEVIGRRPGEFLQGPGTDPEQILFMRSRIRAGLPFQTEIRNYSKSGREYWLAIEMQPLRTSDGRLTGFMAIEVDITSRRKAEQELRRAKDLAEGANEAKSAFLANMSHEIRTPLTGILGFTDVLRAGNVSPPQAQNYLSIIHSCGTHLLTLLNDILDLSKIEAGRMDFEKVRCSPQQVATDVLSLLRVRAQEKGLALEAVWITDVPESIQTDPARLRQLLMNLIANAIKFTERGSVSVLIAARQRDGAWTLEFTIRDTGIGIAAEQIGRIFLPFDQADNSITRKFGGTGLGLAISRHICLGLGGDISVESRLGVGSTFKATIATGPLDDVRFLPLQLSESIQPAQSQAAGRPRSRDLSGVRVLLVEDGETNRDLISLVLTRANARVMCACNGQEGVEAAETGEYDVILMDMQMPVMDGYSAAQRLRSGGCRLPIIALTAHAMRGDREKCIAAGCTGYLTKPIQIDRLLETVAGQVDSSTPGETSTDDSEGEWAAEGLSLESLGRISSTLPTALPKFRQIIVKFIESLAERREQMQRALADDRWDDLARSAHWLKGAGGTVGFECFTEPARRLERAARRGQPQDAENCLREIDCLIDRIECPEATAV